jgi:hypothetical protein
MVLSESIAFLIARNDAYRLTVLGNQEICWSVDQTLAPGDQI